MGRRIDSLRTILRDVAGLQAMLGAAMIVPLGVSLLYAEVYTALSFMIAAIALVTVGYALFRCCRHAPEPDKRQAMMIAAWSWLLSAASGGLPFVIAAYLTPPDVAERFVPSGESYGSSLLYFRNPLHALFEGMSAFTTTGLTMAVHEPSIGHGLLFYRCFAQWIGGAGVVVLGLAIIPRPQAAGALELYQSETTGTKLRPSVIGTARAIWKTYCILTLGTAVYLFLMTLAILPHYGWRPSLFDAICHAMAAQSTGGFSTLDDSIRGYGSYAMEIVHIPPMILGALSLPLYYTIGRTRSLRALWADPQNRFMWGIFGVFVPALIWLLGASPGTPDPLRAGLFQVVSGLSTTGWQTADIGTWSAPAVIALACGPMIIGGAAGATVGGIKLIRAYICSRALLWRLRRLFVADNIVIPFRIGNQPVSVADMRRDVGDAALFIVLYLVILGVSILIAAQWLDPSVPLANVVFEAVSAQSTVGLSTGITDPTMPWMIELLYIVQMWVGRLEVFPVIILVASLFHWRRRT